MLYFWFSRTFEKQLVILEYEVRLFRFTPTSFKETFSMIRTPTGNST